MGLSNKDRILNLLKTLPLTSDEIADNLMLSKQDARTYLLRLKKEGKIKTLGKRGRNYIYTFNTPIDAQKAQIDTNLLIGILKDYLESAPSFKTEINKKISGLEAKLNAIASKTSENYHELEAEIENLHYVKTLDEETARSQEFLIRQAFESPVLENIDNLLFNLIDTVPEIKAAILVSVEGEVLSSALPQDVDEMTLAVMTAALLSLAESAITMIKSGEFEQLFIRGRDGTLLVLPTGPNGVLSISTIKDIKLELIYPDCYQVSEQIAKLI